MLTTTLVYVAFNGQPVTRRFQLPDIFDSAEFLAPWREAAQARNVGDTVELVTVTELTERRAKLAEVDEANAAWLAQAAPYTSANQPTVIERT